MQVGFVGLGNMGGPLAARLLERHALVVHDRREEAVAPLVAAGARAVASPGALAAECDAVLTCLPTSDDVRAVIFGEAGLASGARPDALFVDMTTGDPAATREMSATLEGRGLHLVDAPVSGGPRGAREGTIAIMVGAPEALYRRVAPVLGAISGNVLHAGGVGAGHAVKAGNNLLNLVCRLATFEVVSLLVRSGVDPAVAVAIIQKGSGRSYATEITLPDNILSGKMVQGFTMALMRKDSGIALDAAHACEVPMPLGTLAREILERAIAEHGVDADMSLLALTYERETGARIRPE